MQFRSIYRLKTPDALHLAIARHHGCTDFVSFVDAKTAFHDEYAMQFYDPDHSDDEDRFILLGTNHQLKTLVICHCFRQTETIIRIISARHADASEQAAYWSNRP